MFFLVLRLVIILNEKATVSVTYITIERLTTICKFFPDMVYDPFQKSSTTSSAPEINTLLMAPKSLLIFSGGLFRAFIIFAIKNFSGCCTKFEAQRQPVLNLGNSDRNEVDLIRCSIYKPSTVAVAATRIILPHHMGISLLLLNTRRNHIKKRITYIIIL